MSSLYSVGQMNEFGDALERNGWTPTDVKKASGGNILAHILPLVRAYGEGAVAATRHIIDCDAKPFEPIGLTLTVAPESEQLSNRVRGRFGFDPTKVKLHLSLNQQDGKYITGKNLARELASESVLPTNVLAFYLANPHLIPEEWKDKYVFFWGTIYHDSSSSLYVLYLYFYYGRWSWHFLLLDSGSWGASHPAALLASI